MGEGKIDILLHPIRMRIIQEFVGNKKLTTKQIAESLSDVPQATLYRHLEKLNKSGLLQVVKENKVRGARESIYSLAEESHLAAQSELDAAGPKEHLHYFGTFLGNLLGQFGAYIEKDGSGTKSDGVMYRQASVHLSDDEFSNFSKELGDVFSKVLKNKPAPGRMRRTIATIIIPSAEDLNNKGED